MKARKPVLWTIIIITILCIVAAICFLVNSNTDQDTLTFVKQEKTDRICSAEFETKFGYEIKSGTIHVEQWNDGECVQSAPVMFTKDLKQLKIQMNVSRDGNTSTGVDIQIYTDEYGGSLLTHFAFPENKSMLGWSFTSYEQGDELKIVPAEERILAAMVFDTGEGVEVFDCDTLTSEPERLENAGYMIVIRAFFDSKLSNIQAEETALPPSE